MPILLDACLTSHAYESLGVQSRRTSQKVLTEKDVTVISAINFYIGLNEHRFSVVPSSNTATDSMTDFEKVDRVRGDARLILPLLASKWGIHAIVLNRYFPYWKLLFLSSIFKTAVAQKLCSGFC